MTLNEFANVDSFCRDLDNGNELDWHDYMARIITKLGIENIKLYIPFDMDTLMKHFRKGDICFNNIQLKDWDIAAACMVPLLHCNRITCYSLSERVCILKETARILCERELIQ